ncbi:gamma-glutamylcyclotransferase [Azoarcus sp. L1K30]|uniref:gamma-glutamylcyclotransferase family protein n=1 Tax=Azoarcus sp. L1K30 TaxID=2820277 RepID=UPI001B83FE9A|nr:gamma-glutamylcyclotransferase family protein [Azoarcus sp. L1K30]MBR0566373.1 gamma-glutamylcyclotransferase [Azoarcus sp. L1K30]
MSTPHRHCFTYGSLMTPHIMFDVCGTALSAIAARLSGFSRHPVRGEDYPGMIGNAGHEVAGILYLDVPADALARLDAFEGEQYRRSTVTVRCDDGRHLPADTYVFRSEYAHLLLPGEWDLAAFERDGRARFERKFTGIPKR